MLWIVFCASILVFQNLQNRKQQTCLLWGGLNLIDKIAEDFDQVIDPALRNRLDQLR